MSRRLTNSLVTFGLIAAVACAWLGVLDQAAQTQTEQALKRALITYAITRSLNGAISVAQGTEIALQPAGIGVTLTPGELLDPLNDLIERFSWLTLMAATSLGIQALMTEIFAHQAVNILLTVLLLGLGIAVWMRNRPRLRNRALRVAMVFIIARFCFALVALVSSLLSNIFLLEKEHQSREYLSQTRFVIDSAQLQPAPPVSEESLLDRLSNFLDEQQDALNVQARLVRLQARTEKAVDHVITLMVVFLAQTILLPLAVLYLVIGAIKLSWRNLST